MPRQDNKPPEISNVTQKRADDRKTAKQRKVTTDKWEKERAEEFERLYSIWESGTCLRCNHQIVPYDSRHTGPDDPYWCPVCKLTVIDRTPYDTDNYLDDYIRLLIDKALTLES